MALPTKEEISIAIESGHSINAVELSGYEPVPGIIGPESYSGGFCIVFPFVKGRQRKAVRVWHQEIDKIKERYWLLAQDFKHLKNNALLSFQYVEKGLNVKGQLLDITIMDWVDGYPLKNYILDIVRDTRSKKEKTQAILELAGKLRDAFDNMHKLGLSHGDLQHDNIIITGDGAPRFIDYDCFYTPSMGSRFYQTTAGYHGYQHPSRFKRSYVSNEKSDYFSELVIYTCLIAIAEDPSLVDRYNISESEWMLFSGDDLNKFSGSKVYKDLSKLSEDVQKCLSIISNYLNKDDINDLEPFVNFLDESALKEKIKQAFFNAQGIGTRQAYQDFVDSCSVFSYASYYRNKARKRLSEIDEELLWSVATTDATESSYRDYLQKTELKTHKVEAEKRLEAILWEAAVKKNTLESYREYKLKSPIIRKECEAEIQSIERTQWSIAVEADTTSGYGRYLGYFITGYHSSDARKRISELASINQEEELWCKAKISDSLASYRNYLKESSLRKYAKEALENIAQYDDEAWQKARKADSEAEYKNYIASFPEGIHLQKCNDRIENLGFKEDLKRTFKWVLILIVIIAFIILAIIGLAGNEDSPVPITPIEETRTDSPPPTRIPKTEVNVAAIEEELEYKIEALKLLKESKGQLDQTVLRDAKALLDDLRYKSSNYQEYKKQIDNL